MLCTTRSGVSFGGEHAIYTPQQTRVKIRTEKASRSKRRQCTAWVGCDLTLPCALAIMLAEAISPAMPRSLIEIGAILLFVDTLMVWL